MKIKMIKIKRVTIDKNIRLGMLIILIILIIISSYSVVEAYQQPTIKKERLIVPTFSYFQIGTYDFDAYLIDNTLYGDNTVLKPGEATIFKKLIDHVNASFKYRFQADQPTTVQGTYILEAQILTELWSKNCTIIPETSFNGDDTTSFGIDFQLDITKYEYIINQIEHETGVTAKNPTLIFKCNILTSVVTSLEENIETFTPSIEIPLSSEIIEFKGDLQKKQESVVELIETITTQIDISQQRSYWTTALIILLILLIAFLSFTTIKVKNPTVTEKVLRKIKKKYGEWIIYAEKMSAPNESNIISVKSFEDLFKISEEIGKPMFYNKAVSNMKLLHMFYVFDEGIFYRYILSAT